ncbi:hypothetical protein ABZ543_08450 [Streptomyces roseifaciens]
MGRNIIIDHRAVAAAARKERGVWTFVGVYRWADDGRAAARRIARAERAPSYAPAGAFEAYHAPHQDGGWAVWTRYVEGLPKPDPRPVTRTYRVRDRGLAGREHPGLVIATVTVAFECPVCGGPRGEAQPYRVTEAYQSYVLDRWDNRCGHVDSYDSVLAEHRRRANKGSRGRSNVWPVEAGEYTEAVALLKAEAHGRRGSFRAKQGAQFLAEHGYEEAARRIEEQIARRSLHMGAKQAAMFLAELAAARRSCVRCIGGQIIRKRPDGQTTSWPCPTCRRDPGHRG